MAAPATGGMLKGSEESSEDGSGSGEVEDEPEGKGEPEPEPEPVPEPETEEVKDMFQNVPKLVMKNLQIVENALKETTKRQTQEM